MMTLATRLQAAHVCAEAAVTTLTQRPQHKFVPLELSACCNYDSNTLQAVRAGLQAAGIASDSQQLNLSWYGRKHNVGNVGLDLQIKGSQKITEAGLSN